MNYNEASALRRVNNLVSELDERARAMEERLQRREETLDAILELMQIQSGRGRGRPSVQESARVRELETTIQQNFEMHDG